MFVWVELLVVIDGDIDDKTNQPIAPAIKIVIITAKVTISDLFFMNILYQASQLIDTIAGQPSHYKAQAQQIKAIQANSGVSFRALWGEEMHMRAGDFIVDTGNRDSYGIAQKEFNESYAPAN